MAKECPKCHGAMVAGLTIDQNESMRGVSQWLEGAPDRSMWVGLKLKGKTPLDIQTFRCARCGYLENYAPG